jgi:hypothetical protein
MTSATRAIEAIGDPWLEHVVVGRSICLHQPVTRAVALLPDAAHDGTDTRLPERAELMAAGLLTPPRASSSPQTTIGVGAGRSPVERPVVIGRYQLSGGAVVVLTCDCAWLGPRLQAVLAPIECGRGAGGPREVAVGISVRGDDAYDFAIDGEVVRADVARCDARRFALNVVLVETLRHLSVGAILHGAGVGVAGSAVLLVGKTGAGKSTLALGLAARGFEYLSDDLVPLSASGREVHAFPLAASVKEGSWRIVAEEFLSLGASLVLAFGERLVRYVDPNAGGALASGSRTPALIVVPRFEAAAGAPLVRPLTPEAAFGALLDSGTEAVGNPPSLRPLAELVNTTPAFEMTYSSLDDAADALRDLMRRGGAGE